VSMARMRRGGDASPLAAAADAEEVTASAPAPASASASRAAVAVDAAAPLPARAFVRAGCMARGARRAARGSHK
jgi:hypothetical protein